jgi:hypothetical protein
MADRQLIRYQHFLTKNSRLWREYFLRTNCRSSVAGYRMSATCWRIGNNNKKCFSATQPGDKVHGRTKSLREIFQKGFLIS